MAVEKEKYFITYECVSPYNKDCVKPYTEIVSGMEEVQKRVNNILKEPNYIKKSLSVVVGFNLEVKE